MECNRLVNKKNCLTMQKQCKEKGIASLSHINYLFFVDNINNIAIFLNKGDTNWWRIFLIYVNSPIADNLSFFFWNFLCLLFLFT